MKLHLVAAQQQPKPARPQRRAHRARELQRLRQWHRTARRSLVQLGADYTALCQLDDLAARLRLQVWRGKARAA